MARPSRGEVWRADLEPVRGHEQGRVRPVLVISNDVFNHGNSNLVTIVPMTTKGRPLSIISENRAARGRGFEDKLHHV